jgi:hypothetical protein
LIGTEGTKTPAGVRGWGDPTGAMRRGGSPARPRKAKCLEWKSTGIFNTATYKTIGAECKNKNLFLQSAFSNFILLLVPSHNSSDGV